MVFYIAVAVIVLFVLWGAVSPGGLAASSDVALAFMIEKFGWMYLIAAFAFLVFALFLAFSEFGKIRLGSDDDEPEYSNLTWFAMLFSAGMGIGLVFYGVAEPMYHYLIPPVGEGETPEAAKTALRYSFFHWGLHPWAIYSVIGLSLAYFQFRKGQRGLISSTFYPLLGERINGPIGKGIDILAVIATAFGVATSLGLGVLQINGGLSYVFDIPNETYTRILIIVIVTVLYMMSAATGLNRGIKILSNTNLVLALGLLLCALILGPTAFIFDTLTVTVGGYIQNIVQMSLRLTPFTQNDWIATWTLFYWAWWIAWAPFVGMFIARVSKGRTVKEFVLGVLIVPSIFSFLWFTVFGGTALHFEMFQGKEIAEAVSADMTSALFITLGQFPWGILLSLIATFLIITFFITSADSATFVLGMLSSKGKLNPTTKVKLTWGVLQSSIAIVLLLSGGLKALQTASIITALPFAIVLAFMCVSLLKSLRQEAREERKKEKRRRKKLDALLLESEENK
ncbi:glycine betaine uptake BCCT transporter [Marinicrinis sediminis]|uniref:BCCT family transporter n=1 Tax=Marinicrinis sediminis TaxID=1652465 RepID=A0ABW5R7Q4_9BACL